MKRFAWFIYLVLLQMVIGHAIGDAKEPSLLSKDTLVTDAVPKLIAWFDSLVSEYDKFVDKEKKKQFIRRLTSLNDALYKLQRRKEEFVADLDRKAQRYSPDLLPAEMRESFEDLKMQYERVRKLVDDLGGMVSQKVDDEALAISQSLADAASERRKGINEIAQELQDGKINVQRIRQLGDSGIVAIKTARAKLSKVLQDLEKKD
jgi:hypothetical protein